MEFYTFIHLYKKKTRYNFYGNFRCAIKKKKNPIYTEKKFLHYRLLNSAHKNNVIYHVVHSVKSIQDSLSRVWKKIIMPKLYTFNYVHTFFYIHIYNFVTIKIRSDQITKINNIIIILYVAYEFDNINAHKYKLSIVTPNKIVNNWKCLGK